MAILDSKIVQFNLDNAVSLVNIVDPLEGKSKRCILIRRKGKSLPDGLIILYNMCFETPYVKIVLFFWFEREWNEIK